MQPRVILKTIVSSQNEINLVNLNILENYNDVDVFVIAEANFTHSGEKREYIFGEALESGQIVHPDKVKYLQVDLTNEKVDSIQDDNYLHINEQLIRDGFRKYFQLSPQDIVISVDADEIIYNKTVRKYVKRLKSKLYRSSCYELKLHQFSFRLSNYCPDYIFQGPVICRAQHFLRQEHPQWRYSGKTVRRRAGCHLSWMMTPEQIRTKMLTWSHADETRDFADLALIQASIEGGFLPWDRSLKMYYEHVDPKTFKLLPRGLALLLDKFDPQII